MKRIIILLLLVTATVYSKAQTIKVVTYNSKRVKNSYSDTYGHVIGTPATTINQEEFTGAVVYWKVFFQNYKAIKAKNHLAVQVMKIGADGKEEISWKNSMFVPQKNGYLDMFAEFIDGNYAIYLKDEDNPADVYSRTTFNVPAKAKPDYKHNSTLVVCKDVDDNWNPIGATTMLKAGECMNLLFKAKDKVGYSTMVWNIVKVNADGNEDYIAHFIQGTQGKPFRYLATSSGVCQFNTPGKYHVYLFSQDNYDTNIRRDETNSEYLGKAEITVY